jgi:hypothetical protein
MPKTLIAILLLIATPILAQDKKRHPYVPEQFATAKSIYVEARDGGIDNLKLSREDRNAILDTQDAIQDWGRYTLAPSRVDADLILVVYKGKLTRDPLKGPNATQRNAPGRPPLSNPGDASQPSLSSNAPDGPTQEKDELRVYTLDSKGKLQGPLWRSEQENGLLGANGPLIRRLKDDVERAYPANPSTKQSTP